MASLNNHLWIDTLEFNFILSVRLLDLYCGMEDSNESKKISGEVGSLSLQSNRFPKDLLQRFMGGDESRSTVLDVQKEEISEGIELNLGLSLGGRFGVDKTKLLMRSSSIAGSFPIVRDDDAVAPSPPVYRTLMRTSSLPTESEEELRKRKELQTLRRMVAKRRRSEKQRNLKGDKDGGGSSNFENEKREIEQSFRGRVEREEPVKGLDSSAEISSGLSTWAAVASARQTIFDPTGMKRKGSHGSGSGSDLQPSSQGSLESHGGSSSSMLSFQELSSHNETSPSSFQALCEQSNLAGTGSSGSGIESTSRRTNIAGRSKGKAMGNNSLEDMPCVFTQGDGPNGRRIEGILYRYGKGEDVRIMCVCHGNFLSPSEFIKHAGGSDVDNPLKHIVVNPNSSIFS